MAAKSASIQSQHWFADSGASYLVTGNAQSIQQIAPFEGPDQIGKVWSLALIVQQPFSLV